MWDALVDIMGDAAVAAVKAKPLAAADCLETVVALPCKKWLASTWPDC
jgi:hypothetical protein